MKKFYTLVSIDMPTSGLYSILLDGKAVKTPARNNLACHSKELATLIQTEWASQKDIINPDTMPITQFISTSIDRTAPNRAQIERDILTFLETDLLYFHTLEPKELAMQQQKLWAPWLEISAKEFGPLPEITTSLKVDALDTETQHNAIEFIKNLSNLELTLFVHFAQASSSFLLAKTFINNQITPAEFVNAALCEELFYVDFYGTAHNGLDPQLQAKKDMLERDLKASQLILQTNP